MIFLFSCSISKYKDTNVGQLYYSHDSKNKTKKLVDYNGTTLCLPDDQKIDGKDLVATGIMFDKKDLLKSLYFNQAQLEIKNHIVDTQREVVVKATTDEILKIDTYFCFVHSWAFFDVDAHEYFYVTYVLRNPQ